MKLDPARRRSLRLLARLGAGQCWVGPVAHAAGPGPSRELRIITSPDGASGAQILQALRLRYPALVVEADPLVLEARKGPAMTVSIGPAALRRALEAGSRNPLVSVLTSSQTYRRLLAQDVVSDRSGITAIYAEASPLAQLQLIAAIFERRITVGVLLSDASAYLERLLRQAAASVGLDLLVEQLAASSDVARSLTRLRGAHVLLAVPDSTLYTPETLRVLLESTYRRGMPVVGFSSATVVAGTLATAYCAVDDVVADLVELIEGTGASGSAPLPEPRFPQYWRVIVNENVARSLGMPMSDKVRQLGKQPPGRPR
ncbi:hypothetical protein [Aquabacterium sp. CECT 9606]|uniref:hypothetical protein n=1 Tax=Aquabacterium sp. CECT 9606 TaxID=2845822 RepID=UPI001E3C0136|nr:hypothetical protein [Aquabacterium sp. CECT 9606]